MKIKVSSLIGFAIFLCNPARSEPVYTLGVKDETAIIGLRYENLRISPIQLDYQPWNPGGLTELRLIIPLELEIETEIPTILFGYCEESQNDLEGIINLNGTDFPISQVVYYNWLNTVFLNNIFPYHYPILYSQEMGWVYVTEEEKGLYYMYSYNLGRWFELDLWDLWVQKFLPPPVP